MKNFKNEGLNTGNVFDVVSFMKSPAGSAHALFAERWWFPSMGHGQKWMSHKYRSHRHKGQVLYEDIYKGVCIYRLGVLPHWYSISFFTSHKINLRKIKLISSSIGLIQHAQIKRNAAPSACPISPYTTHKIPRLRENALILE